MLSEELAIPHAERDPWLALRPICESQLGAFSRDQSLSCGFSQKQIEARVHKGQWKRVLPRVFVLQGIPLSWETSVVAALLWAGHDACASHRAAARLWGLGGFTDAPIEVTSGRQLRTVESVRLHRQPFTDFEVSHHGPFRVTSVARTLLDLGATLKPSAVEITLDEALRKGLVTLPRLHHALDQREMRGRKGATVMRAILMDRDPDARIESILERKLLNLIRNSGLEIPRSQFEVFHNNKLVARMDFAYPERLVGIEADGFAFHSGRVQWQSDLSRRNQLTALGWLIIHVTWEDLAKRPDDVIARIEEALQARPL